MNSLFYISSFIELTAHLKCLVPILTYMLTDNEANEKQFLEKKNINHKLQISGSAEFRSLLSLWKHWF